MRLGIYEHYKGKRYEVLGLAHHSETLEELVVYKALYPTQFGRDSWWVRPKAMFEGQVIVDGVKVSRFKYIAQSA